MDPLIRFIISALVGGIVLALVLRRASRYIGHGAAASMDTRPLSSDAINMASIKVAGVGGLGLVATSVVVAFLVPSIGQTLVIALTLGLTLGAGLIAWRRRQGPLPSSGAHPGANTMLAIDEANAPAASQANPPENQRLQPAVASARH